MLNSSDPQSKTLLALGEDELGAWNGSGPRDIRDGVSTFGKGNIAGRREDRQVWRHVRIFKIAWNRTRAEERHEAYFCTYLFQFESAPTMCSHWAPTMPGSGFAMS